MERFWKLANPHLFAGMAGRALPFCWTLTAICMIAGLVWGFGFTPDDRIQGSTVKIMFLHVPSAFIAINCWLMMLIASLVWIVRRHRVSALAARAAAPVGMIAATIAILTGAIWGQPMWGTWWAWDPRLTSFLILFVCYAGYIALWNALENGDLAADLASILCLVGSAFALLSRYAVNFWSEGLHQGATLSLDRETHIHNAFYVPLLVCMAGFALLFATLVLTRTRTEIRKRRIEAILARGAGR